MWTTERRTPLLVLALLACFFIVPHTVNAGMTEDAFNLLIQIIASIVEGLGAVFVFMVDIFLGFARYNSFGSAQPVEIGWVIVRDICNMFFIVILLISAFGTILPFDSSLRYNQVLPKLLVMAVLINFSKTLVQVLVDLSQVVTLTFVNAFRSAGAGNFTTAFRINELLSMQDEFSSSTQQITAQGANYNLAAQIFASFLLALVLIIIANGVMLIMTAYILARIIGLWVALIFSPAAFFVTALPGSLQGKFGSFSSKYWSRLSGMLTGGPVVMFFLYLTFAILQSPPPASAPAASGGEALLGANGQGLSRQLELYSPTPDINAAGATAFLTRVGTSDNVASFIVAVALMLMALEAAVEAANAVDSTVGKFASQVSSASKGLAFGAASLAASSPWLAAKLGYRTVDKRYDLTGKASAAGLWAANKIPIAGQFARPYLMKGMTMRRNERVREAKELMAATEGMTADQRRLVQGGLQSTAGSILGNIADKTIKTITPKDSTARQLAEGVRNSLGGAWFTQGDQMASMMLAQDLASDATAAEDQSNLEGVIEDSLKRDKAFERLSPQEKEDVAEKLAADAVLQRKAQQIEAAKVIAKRMKDQATLDKINKMLKEDPRLYTSDATRKEKLAKAVNDPSRFKAMSPDATSDTGVLTDVLDVAGLATDVKGVVSITNDKAKLDAFLESVKKQDKPTHDKLKTWVEHLQNNEVTMPDGSKKAGMESAKARQARVENDQFGNPRIFANPKAGQNFMAQVSRMFEPLTGKMVMGKADPMKILDVRDRDRLADVLKDGRMIRNTAQGDALKALETHAQNKTLGSADAGDQLEKFLNADGKLADLKEMKAGLKDAVAALAKSKQAALQSVVQMDPNDEITVTNAKDFQKHTKALSYMFEQMGKNGIDQGLTEAVLDGMVQPASQLHFTTAAGKARDLQVTDLVSSYKTVWASATKEMREGTLSTIQAAQKVGHDKFLEHPMERMGDQNTYKQMPRPVTSSLENPVDVG